MRATIALDRNTGAILKTSGQVSTIRTSRTSSLPTQGGSFATDANGDTPSETQGVEELSALVWNFVKAAGTLVDEIDRDVGSLSTPSPSVQSNWDLPRKG